MDKIKQRFDAFSDAIIAIIITIMVLELPAITANNWSQYFGLGKSIGIFLISFFFVANMWYQHAVLFSQIETMTYRTLVEDFIFMALLSMLPLFTKNMAEDTNNVTVMAYGLLAIFIGLFFGSRQKPSFTRFTMIKVKCVMPTLKFTVLVVSGFLLCS